MRNSLKFDPYFESFVVDAFSPVGICIDYWEEPLRKGTKLDVPVIVTNDTGLKQSGQINIQISLDQDILFRRSIHFEVDAYIQNRLYVKAQMPVKKGIYLLEGLLKLSGANPVRSVRNLKIVE